MATTSPCRKLPFTTGKFVAMSSIPIYGRIRIPIDWIQHFILVSFEIPSSSYDSLLLECALSCTMGVDGGRQTHTHTDTTCPAYS